MTRSLPSGAEHERAGLWLHAHPVGLHAGGPGRGQRLPHPVVCHRGDQLAQPDTVLLYQHAAHVTLLYTTEQYKKCKFFIMFYLILYKKVHKNKAQRITATDPHLSHVNQLDFHQSLKKRCCFVKLWNYAMLFYSIQCFGSGGIRVFSPIQFLTFKH